MKVILAIAEDQAIVAALRAALPEGDVLLVESGVEGVRRQLVGLTPDVLVLDDAPRLGLEALQHLRALVRNVPLVALSARGDAMSQAALTQAGADAVLVKPFGAAQFFELLEPLTAIAPPNSALQDPVAGGGARSTLSQHQMALRWLGRAHAQLDDPKRLAESLVQASEDIFDAVRSAILLEVGDCVQVAASHGLPASITGSLRLSYSRGLMRWFDQFSCLIDRATVQHAPDAVKELQLLNARLAAPLLREGRVFGALVLGDKASGISYSPEERELLMLMARSVALSLERGRAVQEERRQHGHMDTCFEQAPVGMLWVLADKTIASLNPEAATLLHLQREDLQGRSIQKAGSAFADVVLRSMKLGTPLHQERVQNMATCGKLAVSVTPVDGGAVVACVPLHEEKVATEDVAYSPFWEYLSSRVAQEVKNPMVAINTFAQLLPRKHDSEDFRNAFSQVVQKEVARINHVVETLFEFARNPKLTLRRCNLRDVIDSVLKTFHEQLSEHDIRLETRWDIEVGEAEIDPVYFSQALHNVLRNSIDAMPQGGTLRISMQQTEGMIEINISDTGPGISVEDAAQVFLPFYSTREKGMGLGLPIAHRILRQHQGKLHLRSTPHEGASFVLQLPAVISGPPLGIFNPAPGATEPYS